MNSNQRSEGNNQSNNGGNELDMNSARAGTADRNNIDPATQRGSGTLGSEGNQQSQQSGQQPGQQAMQSGSQQSGGQQSGMPGTDRQTGSSGGTYQETGAQPSGAHQPGYGNADQGGSMQSGQQQGAQQSTDRSGSQTGSQQGGRDTQSMDDGQQHNARMGVQTGASQQREGEPQRQSNDAAGGYPKSPGGQHMSASEKMNDDTGLSNTANRSPSELGKEDRQDLQSNVGRRSDGTPD